MAEVRGDALGEQHLSTPPAYFYLPRPGQSLVAGFTVRPHVQAFADAVRAATTVQKIGTYNGHDPSVDLALDLFHPIGDDGLADQICWFAVRHLKHYGVDYIISRQRIFNPEVLNQWRNMADRGSPTQNHMDHVHLSFESTGGTDPQPEPTPEPVPQEAPSMFIFDGPPERGGGVWQSDGVWRKPVRTGDTWPALEAIGAKHIGVAPVGLFDDLLNAEDLFGEVPPPSNVDLSAIADRVAAKVADLIAERLAT